MKKEVEFARLCDTFNFPIVFLQDVPGLMVGSEAERSGILHAYEEAVGTLARVRVPKIAVVVRKAYGGGHFALGGRPTHPDLMLAWPTAELGFMAPTTGVQVVHKRLLEETLATRGEGARGSRRAAQPGMGARVRAVGGREALYIDDVIDPRETREKVARGIRLSWGSGPRVGSARQY